MRQGRVCGSHGVGACCWQWVGMVAMVGRACVDGWSSSSSSHRWVGEGHQRGVMWWRAMVPGGSGDWDSMGQL